MMVYIDFDGDRYPLFNVLGAIEVSPAGARAQLEVAPWPEDVPLPELEGEVTIWIANDRGNHIYELAIVSWQAFFTEAKEGISILAAAEGETGRTHRHGKEGTCTWSRST